MELFSSRVLWLDLSKGKVSYEELSKYRRFLGGRGVNQYILIKNLPLGLHPFDPESVLTIGAGLLVGTDAPGACRVSIDTKNVFTGGIGSANVGGDFGPELRSAGISNIVLSGKAEDLIYVCIRDGRVEIRDASHLQHKNTSETDEILKKDLGTEFQVMTIGPAGENLAAASCVVVNRARSASRCGVGAVFGSKNLKAIAVKGEGTVEASNSQDFSRAIQKCIEKLNQSEFNRRRMKYGVYCYDEPWGVETPYRNFSGEVPPEEKKRKLTPDEFLKYKVGKRTCRSCPIACWSVYRFRHGNQWVTTEALQGNDISNFGTRLDMDQPEDVLYAHHLCDELGLDVDVASSSIAWAFDCYNRKIIGTKETRGLELEWGNTEAVFELLRRIAFRDGFGDVIADGCKTASARIGRGSEYCVHVKGNDLFESLWVSPSWALGVVVSPRGGTHTRGTVIEKRMSEAPEELCRELFGVASIGEITSYENKERLVVFMERLNTILDCLGICMFTHSARPDMLLPEDYAELLSAAMGSQIDASELLQIGERVHTLEKCFNTLHTSWTRKDDSPPKVFLERPLLGKYSIDVEKWNSLLDRYYEAHGWNKETGQPRRETLASLGLTEIYDLLKEKGRIS